MSRFPLVRGLPYRHAICAPSLDDDAAFDALRLLERASWQGVAGSFYRFEVPTSDALRDEVRPCIESAWLMDERRQWLEEVFECRLLAGRIDLHRYGNGASIGPHTDHSTQEVRVVTHLNRGWLMSDGGIWILAGDAGLTLSRTLLPPLNNTAFAFSSASSSFHAMSTYGGGALFSAIVRFSRATPAHGAGGR